MSWLTIPYLPICCHTDYKQILPFCLTWNRGHTVKITGSGVVSGAPLSFIVFKSSIFRPSAKNYLQSGFGEAKYPQAGIL